MGIPVYRDISQSGVRYIIGAILYKENLVEFIIDHADLSAVNQYPWHFVGNGLATTITGEKKREVYMHTLIMSPGPNQVVQHISGNGLDNRRANLRLIDKADAALNRIKKRSIELPPLCGLKPEDIPRHVWYVQANGYHRDRFAIEFKTEGVLWKSTSSKSFRCKRSWRSRRRSWSSYTSSIRTWTPLKKKMWFKILKSRLRRFLGGLCKGVCLNSAHHVRGLILIINDV